MVKKIKLKLMWYLKSNNTVQSTQTHQCHRKIDQHLNNNIIQITSEKDLNENNNCNIFRLTKVYDTYWRKKLTDCTLKMQTDNICSHTYWALLNGTPQEVLSSKMFFPAIKNIKPVITKALFNRQERNSKLN